MATKQVTPLPTPASDLGPRAAYANLPIRQNIGLIQDGIADLVSSGSESCEQFFPD